jgi:hypothetical protein
MNAAPYLNRSRRATSRPPLVVSFHRKIRATPAMEAGVARSALTVAIW